MLPSLEVKEFFTPGRTLDKAHVILHIAEPNAPHERERGYLFALVELSEGTIELIETFQKIIDYIEERYYDREEKPEYLLERSLQAVNRDYHDIFANTSSEIHCLVGTVREGEIMLSYHGQPTAVVFYNNTNEQLANAPIITEPSAPTGTFFSEMITGTVNPGDFLYVATPHVNDYFPHDRISKLLTDRNVRDCGAHVQKVLAEIRSDYSFGGIFFHVLTKKYELGQGQTTKPTKLGSEASLNKLVQSTEKTTETLSPPLLGDMKKNWQELMRKPGKLQPRLQEVAETARNLAKNPPRYIPETAGAKVEGRGWLVTVGKTLFLIGRGLSLALARLGIGIVGVSRWVFQFIINRKSRVEQVSRLKERWHESKRTVTSLPLMSKIILSSLIITLVAFVGSLSYLKWSKQKANNAEQYHNLIQAIHDKKDAAEASLMYEDKAKAQTLLSEADTLVAQLPHSNKDEQSAQVAASKELLDVRDKMRGEKRVSADLVADLNVVNPNVKTTQLTLFDNTLIAFGPNDDSWYLVNTVTKQINGTRHDALKNLVQASGSDNANTIVFRSANNEFADFDTKSQSLVKKTISFPTDKVEIGAFDSYNKKLYTVDTLNKKIYRHNQTQAGYDKGTVWNKSGDSSLGGVIDVMIDGNIFALKENGEVREWFRGDQQGFSLGQVDPVLDNATNITTAPDATELFVLDTTHKRVLVFDKNGAFKEQLSNDSWQSPSSIAVTDKGKTIFILDGNRIYRLTR